MKRSASIVLIVLVTLLAALWLAGWAGASRNATPAAPLAPLAGALSVVSYQGQVTVAGAAYSGTGYFKFAVTDAAGTTSYWSNDGTSADGGEPVASVPLTVTNGLFNVLLGDTTLAGMTQPLDAAAFAGPDRVLRVWFSQVAGGPFQHLAPDRRVAAVPYALQAQEAANAAALEGYPASAFQQKPAGVVTVAKSGGDFTAITAALDSITDASDSNRYLVRVAPGVYTETVTMKPYVDIEGAGELLTRITQSGSDDYYTGTVVGASDAELRFLTVENTGGARYAFAISNHDASPRLTHVTAVASGASDQSCGVSSQDGAPVMTHLTALAFGSALLSNGVLNSNSSSVMTHLTASAFGDRLNQAIRNANSSSPTMRSVRATASGGLNNVGVENGSCSVEMTDVTVTASGGADGAWGVVSQSGTFTMTRVAVTASGAANRNYGIYNASGASSTLTSVTASASGGTNNYAIYNYAGSLTVRSSLFDAAGTTGNRYGLYNFASSSGAYTVTLDNSQVTGATASIYNEIYNAQYAVHVGASKLVGPVVENGGAITYDADYRLNADTLSGQHAAAFQRDGLRVVLVARSNGDYGSITAALAAITDAGPDNRYLVRVAPGVYTETVTMKPYVDIEGAGESLTRITYMGSTSRYTGTVTGANDAELRLLTVENAGGAGYATAVYSNGASPRLTRVTATATGATGQNMGVANYASSAPAMTDVTARASGGALAFGVLNRASSPALLRVTATASGASSACYGVRSDNAVSLTMSYVMASASGPAGSFGVYNFQSSLAMTDVTANATGGTESYGVYNDASSPVMTRVTATASGGSSKTCGVYNSSSAPILTRVTATGSGGSGSNCGVYNYQASPEITNSIVGAGGATGGRYGIFNERVGTSGTYTVTVDNSQVTGSANTIYNDSYFTVRVGASQLAGGNIYNPIFGTVICAGSYDENYAFYASTCP